MTVLPTRSSRQVMPVSRQVAGLASRSLVIGLIAFLTVVDLFATQAILPALTRHYGVTPAEMSFAVNASTFGMAVAGLVTGLFSPTIDRRRGILFSLMVLAIPTSLLAIAPSLSAFTVLRVTQGLCMASAFALTLAYLGEQDNAADKGTAFAAYITGNVASNLFGRLISAALADGLGLAWTFYVFAVLNIAGAALVYVTIKPATTQQQPKAYASALATLRDNWRRPELRAAFALGFCILFAFIGTFTFVNFVLVRPPLSLGMMHVGFAYVVFLPSVVTTPMAGRVVARIGTRPTVWLALTVAGGGLPLLLGTELTAVLGGMVLISIGTFFAQAAATGFVGQAAVGDRGVASGSYLCCYFCGGLVGTAVLGRLFDAFGWGACVAGIGVALAAAAALATRLRERP